MNDRVKLLAYRIFGSPTADATARVKAIDAKKAGAKPDAKAEPAPAPDAKAEVKPDAKAEPAPAPDAKAEATPDAKAEPAPAPDAKAEATPEVKAEPKVEQKSKASPDLTAKLVERVHALYEELGRQDVIAVQELEKAEEESKQKPSHR